MRVIYRLIVFFTLLLVVVHINCENTSFTVSFETIIRGWIDGSGSTPSCSLDVPGPSTPKIILPNSDRSSTRGNCTNNLTAPDSLRKTSSSIHSNESASSTGESDENPKQLIATFDEWTKEKLKQEHRKTAPLSVATVSGGNAPTIPLTVPSTSAATRNYASKECGAKVLLSNAEAENTKAVLNDKEKDEYMRNPCEKADNKHIVIELCETIQPQTVELANFELFSSGPRDIRLFAAERFPNGEWQLLGEFSALDSRQLQTFPLQPKGIYAKFVKLELISHHGSEHYCTLSVLKVLGISMVDEYEAEAEAASVGRIPANVESVKDSSSLLQDEFVPGTISPGQHYVHTQVPSFTTNIDDNNDSSSESSAETTTLPQESNPSVIDDVVSGRIIRKIVDVVKDKLGGDKKSKVIKHKVYPAENPFQSCYMCPLDGSSFIFSYLYCRAFVWKPRPVSEKFHTLVQSLPLVFTVKRNLLDRIRRRHVSFLQREMLRFHLQRIFLNGREEIVQKNNFDAAEASTITNVPQTPPQTMPVPAYTTSEALPAGSISHKESVFMKLNKRIAALELNMSLSSEYLSELSRQYVAQTDEHKKNMKQTKRAVEDAIEAVAAKINKTVIEKILVMRNEMDALSAWLSSLRSSASKLAVARISGGPRINPSVDSVNSEECTSGHNTHLNPYVDGNDGVWSTEQVVYAVVIAQVATVLLVAILQLCYQKIVGRSISDTEISVEIENLVEQKVLEALQRQNLERVGHQNATNASKRKRKKKKGGSNQGTIVGGGEPSWDSAVDSTIPSQATTQSEASDGERMGNVILLLDASDVETTSITFSP